MLLNCEMLQLEGREAVRFGPFSSLYFQLWGYLQYHNNLLLQKGFVANLRWKMVPFSF